MAFVRLAELTIKSGLAAFSLLGSFRFSRTSWEGKKVPWWNPTHFLSYLFFLPFSLEGQKKKKNQLMKSAMQKIKTRKVKVLVAQLCPTFCDPTDCSPPGSSVHGILQARILEWVAISFSRDSSQLKDQTWVSHTAGRFFTIWGTRDMIK